MLPQLSAWVYVIISVFFFFVCDFGAETAEVGMHAEEQKKVASAFFFLFVYASSYYLQVNEY